MSLHKPSLGQGLFNALQQCKQRKRWAGPSCSCAEFREAGHCRHLDMFLEAQAAEDSASVQSKTQGQPQGVPPARKTIVSQISHATSKLVKMSSRERRGTQKEASPSSESLSLNDEIDSDEFPILQTSSSGHAISNNWTAQGDFGDIIVPAKLKRLTGELNLLDDLSRSPVSGKHSFRAVSEKHGIVYVQQLRLQAPTCLPDHNQIFNNELNILQKLEHPNIIQFFGYEEYRGLDDVLERRIAFEFAVDSLSDLVFHRATGHERLSYIEVRKYSMDIAEALVFLHEQGIVHRDLTSENVMMVYADFPTSGNWAAAMRKHFRLSRSLSNIFGNSSEKNSTSGNGKQPTPVWRAQSGTDQPGAYSSLDPDLHMNGFSYTAKLSNFEVAKRMRAPGESGPFERTSTCVTSPQYRSPECFRGDMYDESIDVWSYGAIMYEMLAREQPFYKHYTLSQVEELVLSEQFPPQGYFAPKEFRPLERLMHECLNHKSKHRPSMDTILLELKRLV